MIEPNPRRLLRALTTQAKAEDHVACQVALPEFVEAEMAGEHVAQLFPKVQAHLDICKDCDALHAAIIEVLMAEESEHIPEPVQLPSLVLPWPVRLRRWTREVAGATLDALKQGRRELDGAAQAFFSALTEAQDKLSLREASMAFGLGQTDSATLPLVMAAYYTLTELAHQAQTGSDFQALVQAGQLRPVVERAARKTAEQTGLKGQAAQAFVDALVQFALQDTAAFLEWVTAQPDVS